MAQTVVGIFKNSTEAYNAKLYLVSQGFSDDRVDISSGSSSDTSESSSQQGHDDDWGDRISNFFSNLFGNEAESSKYTRAASTGAVVTVHAQSSEEAEKAADILDDYGAIDVDEYAADSGFTSEDQRTNTAAKEVDRMGSFNSGRAGITDHNQTASGTSQPAGNIHANTDKEKPGEEKAIPVRNENVQPEITKTTDGVQRMRSRIVDRPVEEAVRLKEIYVYKERTVINPDSPEEEVISFTERTIIVSDTGEAQITDTHSRDEDKKLFEEVDQKKEAMQENMRERRSETEDFNKPGAKSEGDISKEVDRDHLRDEIHRQRPGII